MSIFSPGLAQGCFELLRIISRNLLVFSQIRLSFSHLGTLPVLQVFSMSQKLGWVCIDPDGHAVITSLGQRILSISGYKPMLRQALLDYIDAEQPAWVQNSIYGRLRVVQFVGSELAQVFIEAGLVHGVDQDVVSFWDSVAALARGQKDSRLLDIGRRGERLSIAYELSRTGVEPKWTAIDSNNDGYDILSVVGTGDNRPLSIEVKTSTLGFSGGLCLTRNEWQRSQEQDCYMFHLWAFESELDVYFAKVTPNDMSKHIPADAGMGEWDVLRIPFIAFENFFLKV